MSPSPLLGLWNRLGRIGTAAGMDPREAKRVILANQFALSISILALLFVPVHFILGLRTSGLISLLAGTLMPLSLLLYRLPWPVLPRLYLVTLGNLVMLLHTLAMGKETNMHLFFSTGAWMGMILFGARERRAMVYSVLLPTLLLIGFLAFDRRAGGWNPIPPDRVEDMALWNLVAFQVIQVTAIFYFYLANHRTEAALAAAGEAAKAADRAKSRFLANISHEIRTPLNGILGLSDLLLKDPLPERQRETLLGVRASARDLLGLVTDLLDISRIEAGTLRLEPAPFRLRPLVESVLAPFRLVAERKGLDLRRDIDAAAPDGLSGDAMRLKQVLNNLLGNALKFTDAGSITLRIFPAPGASPGKGRVRLRFEVEDTGIGIPEEAGAALFQPFSQADTSASRRHEGAGLGLSISRQITERMGGTIGYRSRLGQGSVFHFEVELPAADVPEGLPGQGPEDEGGAGTLGGLRILIVEDNALNRKVIAGMLAARGLRADESPGGSQALEAFARGPYQIVFTDVHMPGMDGYEFTRRLREAEGAGPVVVGVTADAMAESLRRCLASGMDDVLTKPVLARDFDALLGRLARNGRIAGRPVARGDAEGAWVDAEQFRELDEWVRAHDRTFWERSEAQFRLDVARLAAAIREGLEGGRKAEAADAAHSLKGVCLMLGFSRLGRLSKSLEDAIRGGSGAAERLAEIEAGVGPTLAELHARRAAPESGPPDFRTA